MFLLRTIKYHLYLFQLENYEIRRFARLISRMLWRKPRKQRKPLAWTAKARAIFGVALFLELIAAIGTASVFGRLHLALFAILYFLAYNLLFPFLFLIGAAILLWPADYLLKNLTIWRAQRKISHFPELKIIGITGSYGKTTMKEALATVLAEKFRVLKTPENINTPLGVGRLILQELNPLTEVFIVEMGAYHRGDIKALCAIARPKIAILTGINEAHLERFGSLKNTIKAKFEIVENADPGAPIILNGDDDYLKRNYNQYLGGRRVAFYDSENFESKLWSEGPGIEFSLEIEQSLETLKIPVLGEYILGVVRACVIIAKELDLTRSEISSGLRRIRPCPHRLQPVLNPNNILVIDDSYNGNPDGVKEAIKVLGKFRNRRKIYLTPGLAEMGQALPAVHFKIGQDLSGVADLVILIKNSATPFIAEGLKKENFPPSSIIWFEDMPAAYQALPKILKEGDVILLQNDWPDNYF